VGEINELINQCSVVIDDEQVTFHFNDFGYNKNI